MTETTVARRGPYAKGRAKREEILTRALDVIAREGYRGASVKEIAEAVGLSQAGLLHYFDSKEELFTEILRKRDEAEAAAFGTPVDPVAGAGGLRSGYVEIVRHNAQVPGLVELFARLSIEAADPEHPAHRFFTERNQSTRAYHVAAMSKQQASGIMTRKASPDTLARLLQAVSDGLQIQWLLEPDMDMAALVDAFFGLIAEQGHPVEINAPRL